jgi:TonB-dependent starch-binding outer membrane protein SusC
MSKYRWLLATLVAAALFPNPANAQQTGTVMGVVTSQETQQPIQGAQVRVAGTNLGTLTNAQGRFMIANVPQGPATVQVIFIGYRQENREVTVGPSPVELTIQMETDVLGLDELVVIGYGTERRRAVTGAVGSMRATAIEDLPTPTIDNALQGRLAGVFVTQNSGNPGSAITVRVRGSSSISAGNQPLYVIDGLPLNQGNYSLLGYGGQTIDALADLNPDEIESIEVLKDASAAAIYGSRASNGVILITTRRGLADRAEINFNTYYGTQEDWRRVPMLDTPGYVEVYNDGLMNRYGLSAGCEGQGDFDFEYDCSINTDWLDQMFRTAPIYNMDGSIRGGSERTRYFVSGSAFNQEGIVRGFGYERLAGRLNLDYTPFERLTLGTNIGLTRGLTHRSQGDNTIYGPFANAIANPPVDPVWDEDAPGGYAETLYANPVGLSIENGGTEKSVRILGNTFATYQLLPWLSGRVSVGIDQYNLHSRRYDSPIIGPYTGSGGAGWSANSYATKATYEGTLNFAQTFGDVHALSGVVGTSYEDNTDETNWVQGQGFPTEAFRYITSAAQITGGSSALTTWSMLSFFGRTTYSYADRYVATFNLRTDGSSRFGEDNRYGTFPSASFLWRASDEAFMQAQPVFSELALRVSYGRTGNQQQIGNFAARGLFGGGFNYLDVPGIAPTQLANPALRWETTDQLNVGADMAFLNNRLALNLDYYVKNTDDLLVARPVPRTTGFTSIWSNVGSMRNTGFELTTRAIWMQAPAGGFNWTTDFNISRNRNEVTALLNDEPIMSGFASRVEVGQPLGVFFGYVMDGIFQSQDEVDAHAFQTAGTRAGDVRFKDLNGDGVINADDRAVIGSPWPDFEGGLTNTLTYRGVDLSAFLQFSYGNDIYNGIRTYADQFGSFWDNHTTRALDRWTPENPSNTEPRAVWGDPNSNTRTSSRFVEDGSYTRLKNVVLGYTIPADMAQRAGFRRIRAYVQGQNLITWTDYTGFDPEVNYAGNTSIVRGTDFYTLPQARTLTFGINLGL